MSYSATTIDLSRIPFPDVIETLDSEAMIDAFKARFLEVWTTAREQDPSLPAYDVEMLETDPAVIIGTTWSFLRLLDRARVNDAVKAVFASSATGADLDNVVARANVQRLTIIPVAGDNPAVMESDAALLRRYLLSFDRPSAGSRDAYLYHAWTAWPLMHDAAVIGRAIHGRRGDVDIVICGPGGRLPTTEEMVLVRAAVTGTSVKPEATAVVVLEATRTTYAVDITITVARGPDPETVRQEAVARIIAATAERTAIGAEVPAEFISGAAYGPSVLRVTRASPAADIAAHPYAVPVCTAVHVKVEVQG